MRISVFLALLVATFVGSCIRFAEAEKALQTDNMHMDAKPELINSDSSVRRLKATEWWLSNEEEERVLDPKRFSTNLKDKVKFRQETEATFIGKLQGRVAARKAAEASGVVAKTETLTKPQINAVAKNVAEAAKKNGKVWPVVKSGLKILYGVALASLILTAAIAMYKLYA